MPEIRNAYQRVRHISEFIGESRVQAGNGNDTDINRIMERFTRTGILPGETRQGQYADVTALQGDPQDILNAGKLAEVTLEELQAEAERRQKEHDKQQNNDEQQQQTAPPQPPAPNQPEA